MSSGGTAAGEAEQPKRQMTRCPTFWAQLHLLALDSLWLPGRSLESQSSTTYSLLFISPGLTRIVWLSQSSSVRARPASHPPPWLLISPDGPGKKGKSVSCPQTTTDARLKRKGREPQRMKPHPSRTAVLLSASPISTARPNRLTESEAKLSKVTE